MKKMTKEKKNKLTSINDDYLTVYHVKKGAAGGAGEGLLREVYQSSRK